MFKYGFNQGLIVFFLQDAAVQNQSPSEKKWYKCIIDSTYFPHLKPSRNQNTIQSLELR